jgi:hypothetical protein
MVEKGTSLLHRVPQSKFAISDISWTRELLDVEVLRILETFN